MENEQFQGRVGTCLKNKWTLRQLLGVGGMASVYLGEHTIGRRVAIKILHPEVAADAELRERFHQEARAVNRFRHPGVVEIVDIDATGDGLPFLVMELLEGSSLQGLIDRGQVPSFDRLLQLMNELLDVLVAAHAVGIIHRDIKPDNLFVQQNGALKVLDFGIARIRTEGGPAKGATRTGTTIGTVAFMSPEQAVGRSDLDVRADLFAVGATMFRVLAGRHVHDAPSQFQLMMMAAMNPAPPLASVLPGVPAEVALVVDRALAFDRGNRYPDARTMQDDVRALLRRERPPYASALAGGASGVPGASSATGVFGATSSAPREGLMSDSQVMGPTSYAPISAPAFPAMAPTSLASPSAGPAPGSLPFGSGHLPLGDLPASPQPATAQFGGFPGPAATAQFGGHPAPVPAAMTQFAGLPAAPAPATTQFGGLPAAPVPAATAQFAAPVVFSPQAAAIQSPSGPLAGPSPASSNLIPPVSEARPAKSKAPFYLLGAGALFVLLLGAFVLGRSGSGGKEPDSSSAGAAATGSPVATATSTATTTTTATAGPTGKGLQGMPTAGTPPTTMAPTITWPAWGGPGPVSNGPPPGKDKGKKKGKD